MSAEQRKQEYQRMMAYYEGKERLRRSEDASNKKIANLIQASHTLLSIAMNFFSEGEDLLLEAGFKLDGAISKSHGYYIKAAENYCREFSAIIHTEEEKSNYWKNLETLEPEIRRWCGLEGGRKLWVKTSEGLPEVGKRVVVVTKKGNYGINSTKEFNGKVEWKGSSRFTDTIVAWMPITEYDNEI